ncbi:Hypothetical predicted protein [Cloeon dipterum]|uniref:Uncharacterized protein n=2 Tax=Cloeon dipterum TaxID=197152 RepID=A0A8S1CDD2_9INSE|nr:Hypothetical predicted protein [Cloeon dipterum]
MANADKFHDANPDLLAAGLPYPSYPLNVKKLLDAQATSDFSTYEDSYQKKKLEKTEMCALGVNRYKTELSETIYGPYGYCDEMVLGPKNSKHFLGRAQEPHLPETWPCQQPFGMKYRKGWTTGQTLDSQGRLGTEPKSQHELGRAFSRFGTPHDPNKCFGIRVNPDHSGGTMWKLMDNPHVDLTDDKYEVKPNSSFKYKKETKVEIPKFRNKKIAIKKN